MLPGSCVGRIAMFIRNVSICLGVAKSGLCFKAIRLGTVLVGALIAASATLNAQCPAGLIHAGLLYGEGGPANYVGHPGIVFSLPSGTVIDRNFHQTSISRVANHQSSAESNLTPSKIPGGICIVPSGTDDHNKGWSVGNNDTPTLRASDWDDNGRVSSYVYSMGCTAPLIPGCWERGPAVAMSR